MWMDEENMAYIHNGWLFGLKKGRNSVTWDNIDGTGKTSC